MYEEIPQKKYDVVIVGGGASGAIAGIFAGRAGKSVAIIDKNQGLGRKLCITGKGRCNITNACDLEELISNIPENGRFLYSSLSEFSNYDIIDFFEKLGVKTKIERGNRVFPVSDNAKEVRDSLTKELKRVKADIFTSSTVTRITGFEGNFEVCFEPSNRRIISEKIIIATGGITYPSTGSTGDGYEFGKYFGHTMTPVKPCLVGVNTKETFVREISGLTLKNIRVSFDKDGKKIYEDFGELLFTHHGISGPCVLSAGFSLAKYDYKDITCHIDLKPALDFDTLDNRIVRDFEKYNKKIFENSLIDLLPGSLADVIVKLSGIDARKQVSLITKEERQKLTSLLKDLTLHINGYAGIDEAIITLGGIKCKEINPKTMESKLVPGLYFCGEVLDVTAYTGGFNLTIAFSTGKVAGEMSACALNWALAR